MGVWFEIHARVSPDDITPQESGRAIAVCLFEIVVGKTKKFINMMLEATLIILDALCGRASHRSLAGIMVCVEKLPSIELLFSQTFQAYFLSKGFSQFFVKRCHLRFVRSFHDQVVIVEHFKFSVLPDDFYYPPDIHREPSLHAGQQFFPVKKALDNQINPAEPCFPPDYRGPFQNRPHGIVPGGALEPQ